MSLLLDLLLFGVAAFLVSGRLFSFDVSGLSRAGLPLKTMFWVLYLSVFFKRKGATPGMMIMKLKLVETATGAKPEKAFWRSVLGVVSAVPLGLGYAWALIEKDKRTWHDLITGTMIVKA
jgi:uncharacterized RDD family membrane protein YckC